MPFISEKSKISTQHPRCANTIHTATCPLQQFDDSDDQRGCVNWIKNPTTHAAETYCYFPRERTDRVLLGAYRETADGCTIYKPKNSYLQLGKVYGQPMAYLID